MDGEIDAGARNNQIACGQKKKRKKYYAADRVAMRIVLFVGVMVWNGSTI